MMNKLRITKREAVLIILLAIASICYAVYTNFIIPNKEKILAINSEIEVKRAKFGKLEEYKRTMLALASKIEEKKGAIKELERKIPTAKRAPELLVYLDRKLKEHDMEFQSVAFGELDLSNEAYASFSISLSFEGKYDSFIKFVKMLENDDRKFIIDSFSLQPPSRNKPMPFSLSFKAFVLKKDNEIIKELTEYDFLRGKLGKEYPFLEIKEEVIEEVTQDAIEQILEEMDEDI